MIKTAKQIEVTEDIQKPYTKAFDLDDLHTQPA